MNNKNNKQTLLAISTFIVLFSLVLIQVLFMVKSAKLEENHFNHRVVLALREARNAIAREANKCNNMHNYVCGKYCSNEVQYINFQKVDSIIQSNLYIHKINLGYRFEFVNENDNKEDKICISCYEQSLNGLLEQNGIKLIIEFPNQSKFILAQIGWLFYISIISILFVMISFLITNKLFKKERSILLNTKDFIDNMVHEFQTPIANIKFASNLILKRINPLTDSKLTQYTQLIQNENNKISSHVHDILTISSLETYNKTFEELDIHQIIEKCAEIFNPIITQKQGRIKINLNASYSIVFGNNTYLRHVISNLIDNAIKYNNNIPEIDISSKNSKNKIIITISDNGTGIPKNEFHNIFEKYYRISTGNIHNIKGFGLGLNYVRRVIENHNGNIEVKSELNKGSIFTITLNTKH